MKILPGLLAGLLLTSLAIADNPLVKDVFTADPEAHAFGDRLYVYTSHDQPNATYWDMTDWRLLSTADLATWKDHGNVISLKDFTWATKWAWAPGCIKANDKYYLYLPIDRAKIGVAVSDSPEGPFKDALGKPLIDNKLQPDAGEEPIDPTIFTDDDGQSYLYFSSRSLKVVKLDPSMIKLAGPLQNVAFLDAQGKPVPTAASGKQPQLPEGYAEGPFIFKRLKKYYLMYSNGWASTSCLVYATSDNPLGPFTYAGKAMEHVPGNTQHGSIAQFHDKWYIFYHTNELSKGNNFRRSVCVEELTFDKDGKINTVTATKQGPAPIKP